MKVQNPLDHMNLTKGEKSARTKKKNLIRKQLEKQLKDKNMTGPIFEDRIESYLSYWEIEQDLLRDIKIRGPNIVWSNGDKQSGTKKNDSVAQVQKISKEMRDLLAFLDVKVVEPPEGGAGDDNV